MKHLSKWIDGQVYVIHAVGTTSYKIGYTGNDDVSHRLFQLQGSNPMQLSLVGSFAGGRKHEQALHALFAHKRIHREWFELSPAEVANILDDGWRATITRQDLELAKARAERTDERQSELAELRETVEVLVGEVRRLTEKVEQLGIRKADSPRALLTEQQAADYTGLTVSAFRGWRCRGGGPRYAKLGSSVR